MALDPLSTAFNAWLANGSVGEDPFTWAARNNNWNPTYEQVAAYINLPSQAEIAKQVAAKQAVEYNANHAAAVVAQNARIQAEVDVVNAAYNAKLNADIVAAQALLVPKPVQTIIIPTQKFIYNSNVENKQAWDSLDNMLSLKFIQSEAGYYIGETFFPGALGAIQSYGNSQAGFDRWIAENPNVVSEAQAVFQGPKPIESSFFGDIKALATDFVDNVKEMIKSPQFQVFAVVASGGALAGVGTGEAAVAEGTFDSAAFEGISESAVFDVSSINAPLINTVELIPPPQIETTFASSFQTIESPIQSSVEASFDTASFETPTLNGEKNMFDFLDFTDNTPLPVDDIPMYSNPVAPSGIDPNSQFFEFDNPNANPALPTLANKVLSGVVNSVFNPTQGTRATNTSPLPNNRTPTSTNGSFLGNLFSKQTPTLSSSNPGSISNTMKSQAMIILITILAGFFLITFASRS
jgi:hypothetical protein